MQCSVRKPGPGNNVDATWHLLDPAVQFPRPKSDQASVGLAQTSLSYGGSPSQLTGLKGCAAIALVPDTPEVLRPYLVGAKSDQWRGLHRSVQWMHNRIEIWRIGMLKPCIRVEATYTWSGNRFAQVLIWLSICWTCGSDPWMLLLTTHRTQQICSNHMVG